MRGCPSDFSRFICLLNETRISHYSLENPAEFSLQPGAASLNTLNGNPKLCEASIHMHIFQSIFAPKQHVVCMCRHTRRDFVRFLCPLLEYVCREVTSDERNRPVQKYREQVEKITFSSLRLVSATITLFVCFFFFLLISAQRITKRMMVTDTSTYYWVNGTAILSAGRKQ